MATYYKYAERDVNSQIDWSSVGKQISTMLYQQAKMREDKRDAFDKQSADDAKVYENIPTGDMLSLNEKYQNFSDDAQKYRLQQERMLRGGLLDPRDYKRSRQRFLDDTTRFFDLGKEAQTAYSDIMKRMQEGTSSFLEEGVALSVEGLGNLQNLSPMINPATGAVNVARMVAGPDGVQVIDKDHIMDVNEMGQYINFRYDKFDKDTFVQNKIKGLGQFITSEAVNAAKGGDLNQILKVSNPKLRDDFNTYLTASVNELTANPYAAASILGDYMSDEVKITRSKKEAEGNDNLVYVGIDENGGVKVELSESQEKKVKEYLSDQIKAGLSESLEIKGTGRSFDPAQSLFIKNSFTEKDKQKQFELIQKAMSGSDTAMQSLISFYQGTGLNVNPEDSSMTITVEGKVIPIKLGSQVTSGANLAAGLGINPEEYIEWAKNKGVDSNLSVDVNDLQQKFSNVTGVKAEEAPILINTSENVKELGLATTVDLLGRDIPLSGPGSNEFKTLVVPSFRNKLKGMVGVDPFLLDSDVSDDGSVTIGTTVVPGGVMNPEKVLQEAQRQLDARLAQTEPETKTPRKTIEQIQAENPDLSLAEVVALFKAQK